MWEEGEYIDTAGYTLRYEVKVYDEPSRYGIDGGKISKLSIYTLGGVQVCQYDREWVIRPEEGVEIANSDYHLHMSVNDVKNVLNQILERYN